MSSSRTAALIVSAWLTLPCVAFAQSLQTPPPVPSLLQMAQADPARRVGNTEPGYVAPQATVRLEDGPRKAFLSAGIGKKFADAADRDDR